MKSDTASGKGNARIRILSSWMPFSASAANASRAAGALEPKNIKPYFVLSCGFSWFLPLAIVMTGAGTSGAGVLQWADNAGLGLARALSVVERLSADPRLRNFRILPLSAAQLIGTDGRITHWDSHGDVRERRRIEIRMRKST